MSRFSLSSREWPQLVFAALAGAALALAFPKFNVAGLAWLVPGAILAFAFSTSSGGAVFRVGYVAGMSFHLVALHWLLLIPVRFAPIAGWVALSAYLALFSAAWVWACVRLYPQRVEGRTILDRIDAFLGVPRDQRLRWSLTCATLWVAGEMIQARLIGGFPWNLLGGSQYRLLPLVQIASWTGIFGVSFLMVWFSVSLLGALAALVRQPQLRKTWAAELMLPGLGVIAALWFGMHRMFAPVPELPSLKLALIQPSIPQRQIWDERESAHRFQELLRLSEAAMTNKPDLLVWPEAAVPSLFRWDTNRIAGLTIYESITGLARRHDVWMVIGADDAEPNSTSPQGVDYFNSSFLINPAGEVVARYRKRRLVMFGEYVPLARVFPFLRNFTGVTGDFTPGSEDGLFVIRRAGMEVKMSPLICFEDAFPHGARRQADAGTDFLLNLTNNGWFGEGAAQWQHAASALFRAIENGLPLVRCANNGLTCWVDAVGRANAVYFPGTTDIYGAGFKIVQIPVRGGVPRTPTFYAQHGDWFGWSCVAWSALAAGLSWLSRRRELAHDA